jgi:hypothetical protein
MQQQDKHLTAKRYHGHGAIIADWMTSISVPHAHWSRLVVQATCCVSSGAQGRDVANGSTYAAEEQQ